MTPFSGDGNAFPIAYGHHSIPPSARAGTKLKLFSGTANPVIHLFMYLLVSCSREEGTPLTKGRFAGSVHRGGKPPGLATRSHSD